MLRTKLSTVSSDLAIAQNALNEAARILKKDGESSLGQALNGLHSACIQIQNITETCVGITLDRHASPLQRKIRSALEQTLTNAYSHAGQTSVNQLSSIMIQLLGMTQNQASRTFNIALFKAAKLSALDCNDSSINTERRLLQKAGLIEKSDQGFRVSANVFSLISTKGIKPTPHGMIESNRFILLEQLKRPLDDLKLSTISKTICSKAGWVELRNGLPYQVFDLPICIGELAQITQPVFRRVESNGPARMVEFIQGLNKINLDFGISLTEQELRYIGARRVILDREFCDSGIAPQLVSGQIATQRGAKEIIDTPIAALEDVPKYIRERFNHIIVRPEQGRARPLRTLGELIQLKNGEEGMAYLPVDISNILNHLLPYGLCLEMNLDRNMRRQLGIKSSVEYLRYRYSH